MVIIKNFEGKIPEFFNKPLNTITNVMSKTGKEAMGHQTPGMQQYQRSPSAPSTDRGGEDPPEQPCQKCGTFSLEIGFGASHLLSCKDTFLVFF